MYGYDTVSHAVKTLRMHVLGKGAMTLAVAAAGAATLLFPGIPAVAFALPVIAIGGVVLTAVNRLYQQAMYQNDMVALYRDDIAAQFGIAPEQVTRAHLREAAKTNEVIDQALTRQRHKTWLAIGTAVVASFVTYGLVANLNAVEGLTGTAQWLVAHTPISEGISKILGGAISLIGIGTVASISSLVFKGGVQTAIASTTGVGKAAAHDRIREIDNRLSRGQSVSKEQVYGVMVAGDAKLQASITRIFHKSYDHMNWRERSNVVHTVGVAAEMEQVAAQINSGDIRPGSLAYMLHGTATPPTRTQDIEPDSPQPDGRFVERLNLAPKAQGSYRAQVDAQRLATSQGQAL